MLLRAFLVFALSLSLLASEPGLAIRFSQPAAISANLGGESGIESAQSTIPFAAFHVPTNQAPALGLRSGPFTAEITGYISVDLRAQHTFTAELTGQMELLINGRQILLTTNSTDSRHESIHTSGRVRLSKGTNALHIRYTSPTNGPATFRLLWSSRNTAVPIPVPPAALSHSATDELTDALSFHNGAFLFDQYQCARCHGPDQKPTSPIDAPTFAGIGSRLSPDWMASKILDPSHDRPSRMPKLFHDADSKEKSEAIAAYLATLTTEAKTFSPSPALHEAGATLVADLQCRSCHTLPTEPGSPDRISLAQVHEKFQPAALVAYLEDPQTHYPGNPMPNFKLNRAEAESIASFLLQSSTKAGKPVASLAATGKELLQTSGCLNCHSLDLPNQFNAPAFASLSALPRGCLAPQSSHAPRFAFTDSERADLNAFLTSVNPTHISATRIPAEVAVRSVEFLRCNQCHTDNHLPAPLTLGGKLKPEWSAHFIAGEIPQKPRPWLKARMPAFPAYATNLAVGLAALHGHPAQTPAEPPPVPDLIRTGETLIGSSGGFSCVACHAVGANNVQLVVESPGINLAYSGERLLPAYFHRWLMNPLAIEPSTKMPAYFDAEGRSQLIEFFDGDARKQIDAMWQYIRSLPQ